ncbi:MAG: lysylphosphatidylglycerol synthase transmembrane domain-containing protein [Microbacterium sp.]
MKRVLALLRSPAIRWCFLAVALAFAAWYVWRNAEEIGQALARMNPWLVVGALGLSILYVLATLEAWRQVLHDLGHRVRFRPAVALFGVSQLGKYIPGGVWNIAAAAELGTAHRIPRRHSVAAMTIALLVSIVSGITVGTLGFLFSPAPLFAQWGWVLWVGVPLVVALIPPVMNRLVALAGRLARVAPMETAISTRGMGPVIFWSVIGWILAGGQVALLSIGLGAHASWLALAQCIGGYALAWTAGFLVVVTPAGAGIRELVLAACLLGTVNDGTVVAIVLLSRALFTLVDLGLAGVGAIDLRIVERQKRPSAD